MGVSVKGAIVIARYGQTWRGIKPKLAAEHGAVGCIIYSDPRDDGYFRGDTYPDGPMRPPEGVQRGSVMDMPVYPGDPQTPGIGAVAGAKLIPLDQVQTITKIPVLPISYADAKPFLKSLRWRDWFPKPGAADCHSPIRSARASPRRILRCRFNWDRKPLYDVVATHPRLHLSRSVGDSRQPSRCVGKRRGRSSLAAPAPELEEARGLGELLKQGWNPQRTIIYCFWDGEEPALLGSTEWAETHADGADAACRRLLQLRWQRPRLLPCRGLAPARKLRQQRSKDINDPETKMPVGSAQRLVDHQARHAEARAPRSASRADIRMRALGSGSDYTAFIDHLGVASVNLGYGGEDQGGGQYHSIYDDFYWYTHFQDTDFVYGRALAQTAGTHDDAHGRCRCDSLTSSATLPTRFARLRDRE